MIDTEDKKPTYVQYNRHGRIRVISQNQWEHVWLDWWLKINNVRNIT